MVNGIRVEIEELDSWLNDDPAHDHRRSTEGSGKQDDQKFHEDVKEVEEVKEVSMDADM